ncbi:MAG: CotH kinase family protein [bacterium]|nr:CotH kinase family protein [bacterium]
MSSNSTTITDEDGDYPDWIELYNHGSDTINLNGYGLSDDENDPFKWVFPKAIIQPQGYLLIFASDKDRRIVISHWETIINRRDEWKYHLGDASIPANWNTINYDDSNWPTGKSGFGYGDGDDATIVANTISIFVRKVFTIDSLNNILKALLHIDYDDGFVAYLNGVEIARANVGVPGIPAAYNQPASTAREAEIYHGGFPEKYDIDPIQTLLQQGENVLAIQIHNVSSTSSDLSLIPFFTLGMLTPPDNPSGFPEILQLDSPMLHTNFKISSSGETLLLTEPSGPATDIVQLGVIPADISWGRKPDGSSNWFFFDNPTPGTSNNNPGYIQVAEDPQFSQSGGFYNGNIQVILSTSSSTAKIHYSLDGSDPNELSNTYSAPISIASTKVLRARAFEPGFLPSKTVTNTYFINAQTDLPVFSLSTTPANFFDVEDGIYTLGNNYQTSNPYYGSNFWQDWERPIHVEFFEPNGTRALSFDGGVKIVGGWSRANPQKPLAIFARNEYGAGEINYQLFPDRPFDQFQAFILRNGGNDWGRTFFSDGMMQGLVENLDLDIMAFRPCLVYLNGEYWGILNLREKQNEHYIAMYHDVDPDSIDLLEFNASPIHGDAQHYNRLIDFISNNDLSQTANYEYVKTLMDVDNFIDYNVAQIYFDNRDWPGNNIKFWRPRTKDGKWRWLLYDVDWGFGVNAYGRGGNQNGFDYNTLEYATSPQPTPNHHANPSWSTLLLRRLLENEEFKNDFINRFADYFNTIFQPKVVVNRISKIQKLFEPEIRPHLNKWSQSYPLWSLHSLWWNDVNRWYSFIQIMVDFAYNRVPNMRNHIIKKFNLTGYAEITLNVSPKVAGLIKISTIVIENYPWQGNYFMKTPIKVTAIPYSNYKFSRWTGCNISNHDSIIIELTGNTSLTAVFEPKTGNSESVVINEINYNSNANFDPEDWVELFNNGATSIDISGWQLNDSDDNNIYYIPENVVLGPQEYQVLCRDTSLFKTYFPNVPDFIGNFDFGLKSNGESIRLCNSKNKMIDSLKYSNRHPWPLMPDGGGPTLALRNPDMDNGLSISWTASQNHGTPGAKNDSYIELSVQSSFQVPFEFQLYPNYPNPFNATTTISYQLPEPSLVNISIYNLCGQLVNELINENVEAGNHSVKWEADHLSSGIYFYKISIGKHRAIGKCLLLK